MDLKQLRYFLQVAELRSFVKAAELLCVGQPTLSKQIRALEMELNVSLFHRNGRGVLLTPLGARFLEQARGVVHAADAALQVLNINDRRLTGKVVCGLTPSVGILMIPEYVRRFAQQLPDASLSIVNHLSTTLHDQLRASRLDFAILHNPSATPDLSTVPLRAESLYLVGKRPIGKRKDKVHLKELDDLPLIMPSRLHAIRNPVELEASRIGIRINVVLEIDVLDSIFELVGEGVAHTISTRFPMLHSTRYSDLAIQQIVDPELFTHLALLTPLQRTLTPLQQAAATLARNTYMELTQE